MAITPRKWRLIWKQYSVGGNQCSTGMGVNLQNRRIPEEMVRQRNKTLSLFAASLVACLARRAVGSQFIIANKALVSVVPSTPVIWIAADFLPFQEVLHYAVFLGQSTRKQRHRGGFVRWLQNRSSRDVGAETPSGSKSSAETLSRECCFPWIFVPKTERIVSALEGLTPNWYSRQREI